MTRFFKEAWLVLLIMVASALGLAAVSESLKDRIEENKVKKVESAVAKALGVEQGEMKAEKLQMAGQEVYRTTDLSGKLIGWGVPAKCEKSYADELEVMIGLDPTGEKIVGLAITNCKETPGLGEQVKGEKFRDQFKGQSADTKRSELKVVKTGGGEGAIEACTGATISSRSVVNAVNRQLSAVQAEIAKMAKE
jgi:electron transport complex protein RnfG